MNSTRLGVLIHGAGWVSTQHIRAYQGNPNARIVAISSRSLESARARAVACGCSEVLCYDNYERALQVPGIDLVSVCTPQHLHCDNVLKAAEAGKHILIEKPAGNSMEELQRMQEAVQLAGVRTVVSFVLRWNPLFRTLKAAICEGAIGKPYYVETDYLSHNGSWWSGWHDARTLSKGISAFLVAGCHAIDALRWFAAPGEFETADPVEVFGVSGGYRRGLSREYSPVTNTWRDGTPPMEYDGLEVAIVRFSNGVIGKVSVNADCVMPYRFPIRIFGQKGSVFDNRIWSHKFPGQTDWVEVPAVLPDSADVTHHPFQGEIDHFIDCILNGRESHCNLADAVKTHAVVFAALESEKTGLPVAVGGGFPRENCSF